jgi:hypothetical protein
MPVLEFDLEKMFHTVFLLYAIIMAPAFEHRARYLTHGRFFVNDAIAIGYDLQARLMVNKRSRMAG